MDTYLPYENFKDTAEALKPGDALRCVQAAIKIMEVAHEYGNHERNAIFARHPMVGLWGDAIPHLGQYAYALFETLTSGHTLPVPVNVIGNALDQHMNWATSGDYRMEAPRWLGDPMFHAAQRAGLMRLDPLHYGPKWPDEDMDLPQYWPAC